MDELKNLWNTNQLEFHGTAEKYRNHYAFKELIDFCYDAEWIPYCKKTFNGAQSVIDYLGKYTHNLKNLTVSFLFIKFIIHKVSILILRRNEF